MSTAAHDRPAPVDPVGIAIGGAAVAVLAGVAVLSGAPTVLLVIALAVVGLIAGLARPEVVAPVVLFLLFLDVPGVAVREYGAPAALAGLIILALAVPVAARVLKGGRLELGRPIGLIVLFAVIQLTSTVASREPGEAASNVATFLIEGLLLAVLILNAVRSVETLELALWALLAAGGLLGAVSIFQQVTGTFDHPYGGFALVPAEFLRGIEETARLSGPLGDPNYYAQILVPLIPIGLIALRGQNRRLGTLALIATLGALGGIVLSYSRGGALALLLMLVLATAFRYVKGSQLLVMALAAVVALAVVPDYRDRVASIGSSITGATQEAGSSEAADQAVRGRTGEMAAAALVFEDHPVLGVGPGVFPLYYQQYIRRLGLEAHTSVKAGPDRGEEARREAHNIVLSFAAELGLAGVGAFLAILAATIGGLIRARRRAMAHDPRLVRIASAMIIAITGYVITGLFLTLAYERYFWTLIALSGAVMLLERQSAAARPDGRSTGDVPATAPVQRRN